jgi:hypothetical protein
MEPEEFFTNIFIGIFTILSLFIGIFYAFYIDGINYFHYKIKDKRNFSVNTNANDRTKLLKLTAGTFDLSLTRILNGIIGIFSGIKLPNFIEKNIGYTLSFILGIFILLYSLGVITKRISDRFIDGRDIFHLNLKRGWAEYSFSKNPIISKISNNKDLENQEVNTEITKIFSEPHIYFRNVIIKNNSEMLEETDQKNKIDCATKTLVKIDKNNDLKGKEKLIYEQILQIYYSTKTFIYLKNDTYIKLLNHQENQIFFFSSLSFCFCFLILCALISFISNISKLICFIIGFFYDPYVDERKEKEKKSQIFTFIFGLLTIVFILLILHGFSSAWVVLFSAITTILIYLIKTFFKNQDLNFKVIYLSFITNLVIMVITIIGYFTSCDLWMSSEIDYNFLVFNYSKTIEPSKITEASKKIYNLEFPTEDHFFQMYDEETFKKILQKVENDKQYNQYN